MHSLLYRLFGAHFFIDRSYALLLFLGHALLLPKLEKQGLQAGSSGYTSLLAVFLLPLFLWGFQQNMLEASLSFFSLLAAYLLFKNRPIWAAAALFAALASKGLPALYLWALPFWSWLFLKQTWQKSLLQTLLLVALPLLSLGLCYVFWPSAHTFLDAYLHEQLFKSLSGQHGDGGKPRYFLIKALFEETLPLSIFAALLFWRKLWQANAKVYFALALGFSACIPLIISPKQMRFYLIPSLPWFALAFVWGLSPLAKNFLESWALRTQKWTYLGFFGLFFYLFSHWGRPTRDAEIIKFVDSLALVLPPHDSVCLAPELQTQWAWQGYLYHRAQLNAPANCQPVQIREQAKGQFVFQAAK